MAAYIKKAEIILIIILIAAGIAATVALYWAKSSGDRVVVTLNGEEYASYDLHKDKTIKLDTGNTIYIEDGKVFMEKTHVTGRTA